MRRKWIVAGLLGISLLVQAEEIREIQTIDQLLQEEVIPIVEIQELEVKKIETKVPETEIPEKKVIEKKIEESKKEENKERKEQEIKEVVPKETKIIPEKVQTVKEMKTSDLKKIVEKPTKEEKVSQEVIEDTYLAGLVADTKGNIYYSKNIDKKLPMASITKVMTLLVTFDAIRNGEAHFEDKVIITKDVYNKGGSGISMKPGETFTLLDLIRATAIYSANNAAYAIARYIGKGSISNFIKKMNKKAREVGVSKEISYYSPAGLPSRYTKEPMDIGTARGIYKLSLEAIKYPEYMKIAGIKQIKIHHGKINIRNRNHLIGEEGIYGIKTGYHKEAKYNITVASKDDSREFIVVILGGESYKDRDNAVLRLLEKVKRELR
ncbi:D-alanyl-D-alanine carboxypeptidase [Fusobacterium necrophorum BL]|uniref:D-alanyl-D-alanine carboxypeptidase n=1 Tax=Fusobacterium necrophorum BL TaxID=1441732 RepID=A0AB73BYT2_9FUSO|nr:D-alanyl-D-alanine carboxypeptidase family protein [Fusobacterium necrophorum]KDE65363.1 D-alanyl-D-alanine carboxypeptidase [Fusobacterium necrophorum BL]